MSADMPDMPDIPDILIPETAVSVAGLTAYIRGLLEDDENLGQIWAIGEVSSCRDHRRGLFFTMQDEGDSIRCVSGFLNRSLDGGFDQVLLSRTLLTRSFSISYLSCSIVLCS